MDCDPFISAKHLRMRAIHRTGSLADNNEHMSYYSALGTATSPRVIVPRNATSLPSPLQQLHRPARCCSSGCIVSIRDCSNTEPARHRSNIVVAPTSDPPVVVPTSVLPVVAPTNAPSSPQQALHRELRQ